MESKPYTMEGRIWPSRWHCSKSWEDTLEFFTRLANGNAAFLPLKQLAQAIVSSPYPAAGLYGLTSMHDILLGRSTDVLGNPHLRISYNFKKRLFQLTYQDFTRELWTRTCTPEDVWPVLERFLLRRARWFQKVEPVAPPTSTRYNQRIATWLRQVTILIGFRGT